MTLLISLVLALSPQVYGFPSRPSDLKGDVLQIIKPGEKAPPATLLVQGNTPTTSRTHLHVTEATRLWKRSESGWAPAEFDDIQVGMWITAAFVGSKALLSYPIQATALELGVASKKVTAVKIPGQHTPGDKPLHVGGISLDRRVIHRVEPEYPEEAKEKRLQGVVLLQILIDKIGNVEDVTVIRGHPLLAPAAVKAVKQWKYDPIILDGGPVRVIGTVMVNFVLDR